jgi:hypothetical protein
MNGNTTWAKTRSTTVTVSDAHTGVNPSSLKYLWNTSTTQPTETSFTTAFTNGGTLTTPTGVTGSYYLWILAKDNAGNTTITRTNVFNIDNTVPVITLNGSSTVTIDVGSTYTDAGATATDAHSGINGSVTKTGSVNTSAAGTYTLTYNVSDNAGNAATPVTRTVTVRVTYTCSSGNLVNDPTKGYICVVGPWYTSGCNTCSVTRSTTGANCSSCGSTCNSCYHSEWTYLTKNCTYCGSTGGVCNSCNYEITGIWGASCNQCGSTCNTCTYSYSETVTSCSDCGGYSYYYCSYPWQDYTGSGSSLTCYVAATKQ